MGRDGRTELQYWHIRPAVANGQRVSAYRTVVGWVEAPWEHVHFSEMRDGVYLNPLRPGALGPFADTTRPWIKQLRAERDGRPVPVAATHGSIALVVEAYDDDADRRPRPLGRQARHPALVRWRLTTARPAPSGAGARRSTTG